MMFYPNHDRSELVNRDRPRLMSRVEIHRNNSRAAIYIGKASQHLLSIAVWFRDLRRIKHIGPWVIKDISVLPLQPRTSWWQYPFRLRWCFYLAFSRTLHR